MTEVDVAGRQSLQRLASARVDKLAKLVLPPGHEPVLDVMGLVWIDGLEVGLQLTGQHRPRGLPKFLPGAFYEQLAGAELCGQYQEFPELDDRDFQNLAFSRVQKITRPIQPASHPEVSGYTVEIWTDGVAAGLRIMKRDTAEHPSSGIDWG